MRYVWSVQVRSVSVRLIERFPPVLEVEGREIPVSMRIEDLRLEATIEEEKTTYVAHVTVLFEAELGSRKLTVRQHLTLNLGPTPLSDLELFDLVKKHITVAYPVIRSAAELLLRLSAALGALGAK